MTYYFSLHISAEQFLPYYRGQIRQVVVRCENGQKVQFPARFLLPLLRHGGIRGRFALICNAQNKVLKIEVV